MPLQYLLSSSIGSLDHPNMVCPRESSVLLVRASVLGRCSLGVVGEDPWYCMVCPSYPQDYFVTTTQQVIISYSVVASTNSYVTNYRKYTLLIIITQQFRAQLGFSLELTTCRRWDIGFLGTAVYNKKMVLGFKSELLLHNHPHCYHHEGISR
ncbi:hypothetical protein K491DRAFT_324968 [Lophiostoma macrostomum CBS 122681]|uniref:Uncharacterized protein n=1 Tax=Lophiostoma macrostomum CBS 122681 TaxID=1314788 RepID=A0A6A6TF01_9PLEO|nr:hypothetical protein K491DRAFT_324968 [Lophiostoma macrostomum CBS 122681]